MLDWGKKQQIKAAVRTAIEEVLDKGLLPSYDEKIYEEKYQMVYYHIYEDYYGAGQSIYTQIDSN